MTKRINRRDFFRYSMEAAGGFILVGCGAYISKKDPNETGVVRPPRTIDETVFLEKCIRCGVCVEVCPTRGLEQTGFSKNIMAMATPVINPEYGGCTSWKDGCDLCARHCPTNAIDSGAKLEGEKLAIVKFERDKCNNCMSCFKWCPIEKAVLFENPHGDPFYREKDIPDAYKTETSKFKPFFNMEKCVGCGLCVHYCPKKAIHLEPLSGKQS